MDKHFGTQTDHNHVRYHKQITVNGVWSRSCNTCPDDLGVFCGAVVFKC